MNRKLKSYILLMRLNSPIGSFLLMYPCLWGLIVACGSFNKISQNLFLFIIFILGSFVMRSAGCVINDIFDINIDDKVDRTKTRPLASGAITLHDAIFTIFNRGKKMFGGIAGVVPYIHLRWWTQVPAGTTQRSRVSDA